MSTEITKGPFVVGTDPSKSFHGAGVSRKSTEKQYTADAAPSQGAEVIPFAPRWSPDQDRALVAIEEWRRAGDKLLFKLHGFAGVGKSTLLAHLARNIPGAVVLCPTNKACAVLKAQGIRAQTIHSFAYSHNGCEADRLRQKIAALTSRRAENREELARLEAELEQLIDDARRRGLRPTGELFFDERDLEARPRLLIIDEGSMVKAEHADRIMSFGIPVLAVADPFQLPPVKGRSSVFVTGAPDAMLSQIHRQAAGSAIIRLSQSIREGRPNFQAERSEAGEVRILRGAIPDEALVAVEQIVVGRHVIRRRLNARVRALRSFESDAPEAGERLLCKTNSYEDGRELCNGEILIVESDNGVTRDFDEERWHGDVRHDGCDDLVEIVADLKMLRASADDNAKAGGGQPDTHPPPGCDDLHYGYAITCHAAQGSQWPSVLVNNDPVGDAPARWLYTAVTRAQKELTLVMGAVPRPRLPFGGRRW